MPIMRIREADASDIPFIYDSFLKSYKAESSVGKATTKRIFFREYPTIIDCLLSRSNVSIMCWDAEPNVIIGYIIFEPSLIHYVFVKEVFRKQGMGRSLLKHALGLDDYFEFTHRTNDIKQVLTKYPNCLFNPFKLYKKEVQNG